MTIPTTHLNNWIVDYDASHNITYDLQNLFIHNNYEGNEDIIISDSNKISITHIGSTTLNSCINTFILDDILYASHIK